MPQSIRWQGNDCFTHLLVVGPTRSGKTATILKPMIYQLLLQKRQGIDLGLSVVEPKGDLARMVNDMCIEMDIPCVYIDPESPGTHRFNPMEGDIDDVAEATVVVLKGMFGKQEAFFATIQELSARNITRLLKTLHGNDIDITDVMNTLRDPKQLEQKVKELKWRDGVTDLVLFFENELLGSMKEKYRQFVVGLRAQLENMTSNRRLRNIMSGRSDINMDAHFANGGVLAVNTDLGRLRKAGDAFGQFIIMHLQNATFRRPGTEETRMPHFLIVDELSRYINPDLEIFLSLAAEFKVAGVFAVQSLAQLEVEAGTIGPRAVKQAILTSCRNKVAFSGLSANDAKEFADEFGMERVMMRQKTFHNHVVLPNIIPASFRDTETDEYRFYYTQLMELPRFHFVYKLLEDGVPRPPQMGKGNFVPHDWKALRVWEKTNTYSIANRLQNFMNRTQKPKQPIPKTVPKWGADPNDLRNRTQEWIFQNIEPREQNKSGILQNIKGGEGASIKKEEVNRKEPARPKEDGPSDGFWE